MNPGYYSGDEDGIDSGLGIGSTVRSHWRIFWRPRTMVFLCGALSCNQQCDGWKPCNFLVCDWPKGLQLLGRLLVPEKPGDKTCSRANAHVLASRCKYISASTQVHCTKKKKEEKIKQKERKTTSSNSFHIRQKLHLTLITTYQAVGSGNVLRNHSANTGGCL